MALAEPLAFHVGPLADAIQDPSPAHPKSLEGSSLAQASHPSPLLEKRSTPKIGGSAAGFIALVVVLVVIIIVSCTAVFFLLRENHSPDVEQSRRRTRNKYTKQTHSSAFAYDDDSVPTDSWLTRSCRFFGIRAGDSRTHRDVPSRIHMGNSTSHGWIPAGSGSDWSDSVDELSRSRGSPRAAQMKRPESPLVSPRSILSGQQLPSPRGSVMSSDSATSLNVRFDLQYTRSPTYADRFPPSPQSTLPNIHTQLSSPSLSPTSSSSPSIAPVRTASPEPISDSLRYQNGQGRQFATQSGTSMQTFEGGTKFIEAL